MGGAVEESSDRSLRTTNWCCSPLLQVCSICFPGFTPRLLMNTSLAVVHVKMAHCSSSGIESKPTLAFRGSPYLLSSQTVRLQLLHRQTSTTPWRSLSLFTFTIRIQTISCSWPTISVTSHP